MKFVFDVDDTLYDMVEPFKKALDETFIDLDVDVQKLFIKSRHYSDEVFEKSMNGEISIDDMYVYRISHALSDFGIKITRAEALAFQKAYGENQTKISMHPLVFDLFTYLKDRDLLAGLITNGMSQHQRNKVKNLNVSEWLSMDKVIVSGDYGVNKPDAKLFEIAQKQFNINDEEIYFVGDTFESDVIGAFNAGWIPIWLNFRDKVRPESIEKDFYEVHNYSELVKLIQKLVEKKDE